jgi:hypothetical protein
MVLDLRLNEGWVVVRQPFLFLGLFGKCKLDLHTKFYPRITLIYTNKNDIARHGIQNCACNKLSYFEKY